MAKRGDILREATGSRRTSIESMTTREGHRFKKFGAWLSRKTGARFFTPYSRDRRGIAAAEFAIIAPLLMLMLGGMLIYGLYFATLHSLQQIVAEASRATIAGLNDTERETLAREQINGTIGNYALLQREFLQVRAATDPVAGDRYIVTVTYDATHLGLDAFGSILPQPPNQITRVSVIRKGGA